jgi:DNA (cytosine-5)-methyltransferase 1
MHSIELFTGAGGLALGTHKAGFRHRALYEWNKQACETIQENARRAAVPGTESWAPVEGDVRGVNFAKLGPVDLVAGGPPCQPFSIGGKHHGEADVRNMIPEFARAVSELEPRAFLMENVKGLLRETFRDYFEYSVLQLSFPKVTPKEGEDWRDHLRRLEEEKEKAAKGSLDPKHYYEVVFKNVVNAADYGIPQTRERVFVVGFRADLKVAWQPPEKKYSKLALVRDQWVTDEYWRRYDMDRPSGARPPSAGVLRLAAAGDGCKPWRTVRDVIHDLPKPKPDTDPPGLTNHRLTLGAKTYAGHTGSPIDLPAKTLKAGVHGVPGGENMLAFPDGTVRYFTVREAARLQTFPDEWEFAGAWSEAMRQLGNAVPMELAQEFALSIAKALGALDAS